ncbi:zinc finger protein 821 isoform X2 [Protopterus annectens]|nr:zinc finger protein 821 isoform X2 [Protopterus annectens]XP_043937430.1 zinc finger protein 821 isoform X2 [Protopterus annectens]
MLKEQRLFIETQLTVSFSEGKVRTLYLEDEHFCQGQLFVKTPQCLCRRQASPSKIAKGVSSWNMSRRKQTTPNKLHWEQMFLSLGEGHSNQLNTEFSVAMEDKGVKVEDPGDDFADSSGSDGEQQQTADETSSQSSYNDDSRTATPNRSGNGVTEMSGSETVSESKVNDDAEDLSGSCLCPLCQLDCGNREHLISHVYQHTAMAISAKSYICPVCGRALSSPGSLGRHLLIHSEDQLSNCAVCGARFSSSHNFKSEKLSDFLKSELFSPDNSNDTSGGEGNELKLIPVYPAGILLVCNNCTAYRQLVESQTPSIRKWAVRRQNEPLEVRLQRLERERTAKKSRRDSETPEEREIRRMRDREAKRLQRMQETDEQRARRLQRDREAMRLKRANETPEKRQARLIREREAKRIKRRLEKMDMMLRAQFAQDPTTVAALAADINLFNLPDGNPSLDSQLLEKLACQDQTDNHTAPLESHCSTEES